MRFAAVLGALLVVALPCAPVRADLVSSLGTVATPGTVAFHNAAASVGTTSTVGPITYNFLDQWNFTLDSTANVSSIAAAINFTDPAGLSVLFGISNLQVNLLSNPAVGAPLVSWLTVTTPVVGLQQVVALIPTSPLLNGDYMLQIRGTLVAPGSYSGSLIASAVPVPDTLPMLVAGLAVMVWLGRRRGLN